MLQAIEVTTAVYTVSQLNREARNLLEDEFSSVWLQGEISNLRIPSSGHYYFSLKDARSQIRCALFRNRFSAKHLQLKDGIQVLVQAAVSLYEERGDFQLIIEHIEEIGDGVLRRAFEMLKHQLAEEGLFDTQHKQPLPAWPRCIGIVTSPTGAAVRDILQVLQRRAAGIPVIIYPTQVQGAQAADQIVQALQLANQRQECDVLLLARGGGSLEDLWPFNEERVARALFASAIPVITGIGHEVDVTIADFVADLRAPTPSAAAELISPNYNEQQNSLTKLQRNLVKAITNTLQEFSYLLNQLHKRLPHPQRRLQDQLQRLDSLESRLCLAHHHLRRHKLAQLQHASLQLHSHSPALRVSTASAECQALEKRLTTATHFQLANWQHNLTRLMQLLDNVSPLNVLNRGYALATHAGNVLQNAKQVSVGDKVHVRLAKGELDCTVEELCL